MNFAILAEGGMNKQERKSKLQQEEKERKEIGC